MTNVSASFPSPLASLAMEVGRVAAVKTANLMGSLQMPKRGSFKIWNVDGTFQSTRTAAKRRGLRHGFLARCARLRWRP
jgi:hypothetical protein